MIYFITGLNFFISYLDIIPAVLNFNTSVFGHVQSDNTCVTIEMQINYCHVSPVPVNKTTLTVPHLLISPGGVRSLFGHSYAAIVQISNAVFTMRFRLSTAKTIVHYRVRQILNNEYQHRVYRLHNRYTADVVTGKYNFQI